MNFNAMKHIFFSLVIVQLALCELPAQLDRSAVMPQEQDSVQAYSEELLRAEEELAGLFEQLYVEEIQTGLEPALDSLLKKLPAALLLEGAADYPWTGLKRIGVLSSEDGILRVFSWHVKLDADHFRYYGFMQTADRRGIRVFALHDNEKPQRNVSYCEQTLENWYGKLYYRIVSTRNKRNVYYTLLGMDFNNSRSIIKTAEVLQIKRGKPVFLRGMFSLGGLAEGGAQESATGGDTERVNRPRARQKGGIVPPPNPLDEIQAADRSGSAGASPVRSPSKGRRGRMKNGLNVANFADRFVLEYSSQVAISMQYDPELELITFSHLVPFHPIYQGNFEFYGPDGSYDGLEFVTGVWVFRGDVDARLQY
ncbi:MAG: hypothetical protein CSA96_01860 [Bacteroidetes bacterium]|nr:MAG: hypothetical protein CSA96_01860 [Bacteroidota bacterium]